MAEIVAGFVLGLLTSVIIFLIAMLVDNQKGMKYLDKKVKEEREYKVKGEKNGFYTK